MKFAIYCNGPGHAAPRNLAMLHLIVQHGKHSLLPQAEGMLPGHVLAGTGEPVERYKYSFRCGDCGQTVPVRYERLRPIVELMADAGMTQISLRALSSTLETQ